MKNLVSIIIPVYNRPLLVADTIKSILLQTYKNWECIVVNDGSPDNTKEVADEWLKKDARYKYIEQENKGLSGARNAGVKFAKGKYILPLDADDKISEDYLELAMEKFLVQDSPKVVYCRAGFFGEETGEWLLKDYSFKDLLIENMIFCSAFFKKADWESVGGYDKNMKFGLEDWEFWINLLKSGGEVKRIEKVCFFYRVKDNSMLKNISEKELKHSTDYITNKYIYFFVREFGSYKDLFKKEMYLLEASKSPKRAINILSHKLFKIKLFQNNFPDLPI